MTSVDDIRISLRIDDTSNLGKLQKQLTTLVGERGEKKLDLAGIGGITKTDFNFIKSKLMELSPAVLGTEVKGLKESAKVSLRQLMKKEIQETLIAKYGMPKTELESWMIFLSKALTEQDVNTAVLANFIERIHDLIFGTARMGGREKTRLTGVREALREGFIEEEFIRAMEDAGKFIRSQYQYYEIDPEKAIKYKEKIDEIIEGTKEKIKELHGVEYTAEIGRKIIKLSQDTKDSDEFIQKALKDIIGLSSNNAGILIQKLKIGAEDPLLTVLALLRVKSAEDKRGLTLIENLNHYVKDVLKKSIAESIRKSDIRMSKEDLKEILEKADEYGIKVEFIGGKLEDLDNELDEIVVEIKKTFTKGVADQDIRNDNRLNELGKTFLAYFVTASTKQGRRAMERWQKTSGIGKYIRFEGDFRKIEKLLGVQQDHIKLMRDAEVFKEYDKNVDIMESIKENMGELVRRTAEDDPDNLRNIFKELYGLEKDITDLASEETAKKILDAVETKERPGIDFKISEDPFKET